MEDVQVNQGILERLLGYGTVTVPAADDATPQVSLFGISGPIAVKEKMRTHYRAARKREGVRPPEFMRSPDPTPARAALAEPPVATEPRAGMT